MTENKIFKTSNCYVELNANKAVVTYLHNIKESKQDAFAVSYGVGQFGYGLIDHLVNQKDEIAIQNFAAISFAMNSLFASNADFRTKVQKLLNTYLDPKQADKE